MFRFFQLLSLKILPAWCTFPFHSSQWEELLAEPEGGGNVGRVNHGQVRNLPLCFSLRRDLFSSSLWVGPQFKGSDKAFLRKGRLLDKYKFFMNMCSLWINMLLTHGPFPKSPLISKGAEEVHVSLFGGVYVVTGQPALDTAFLLKVNGKAFHSTAGIRDESSEPPEPGCWPFFWELSIMGRAWFYGPLLNFQDKSGNFILFKNDFVFYLM